MRLDTSVTHLVAVAHSDAEITLKIGIPLKQLKDFGRNEIFYPTILTNQHLRSTQLVAQSFASTRGH